MSRLCAKPTCSDVAERWFDVIAAECQVVERREATASSIALCGSHATRFSAPKGWDWVGLDPLDEPAVAVEADVEAPTAIDESDESDVAEQAETPAPSSTDTSSNDKARRKHTRESPWFLANAQSDSEIEAPAESPSDVPTAGSLLHRAFHGPDRDSDSARAREADREPNGRREPRTPSPNTTDADDDDGDVATVRPLVRPGRVAPQETCYDVELPFPPLDDDAHVEPHVAV